MKIGQQISVSITSADSAHKGKTLVLDVEDFQPVEPSNYAWTAGWECAVEIRGEAVWFFVDESGVVWEDGSEVGICPEQEREYERIIAHDLAMEELAPRLNAHPSPLARMLSACECGDPGDCNEIH